MKGIENFIDHEGKIKIWPSKTTVKLEILRYLANKFDSDYIYSEKEVNIIIEDWHTFNDYFLLRRALIDWGLMCRTRDGSKYWRNEGKVSIEKIDWC